MNRGSSIDSSTSGLHEQLRRYPTLKLHQWFFDSLNHIATLRSTALRGHWLQGICDRDELALRNSMDAALTVDRHQTRYTLCMYRDALKEHMKGNACGLAHTSRMYHWILNVLDRSYEPGTRDVSSHAVGNGVGVFIRGHSNRVVGNEVSVHVYGNHNEVENNRSPVDGVRVVNNVGVNGRNEIGAVEASTGDPDGVNNSDLLLLGANQRV